VQDKKYLVLPLVPSSDKGMKPFYSPQVGLYFAPYDNMGKVTSLIDPNAVLAAKPPVMLQTIGNGGGNLAGNVLIDQLFPGFPCHQYGFAFQGAQQAIVYSPCQADGSRNGQSDMGFIGPTKIGLPMGSGHICAPGDMPCQGIDALHAVDV